MKKSVWDYFEKCDDDDDKKAKCQLCNNVYRYNSTSHNLKMHLKRQHYNEIDSILLTTPKQTHPKRRQPSLLWAYYTKCKNAIGRATCNICNHVISYKTTTTNLKAHLQCKHPEDFKIFDEDQKDVEEHQTFYFQTDEESNESKTDMQSTNLWNYFERENGGRVKCAVCRSSMPHSTATMKSHLVEKHPKLIRDVTPESDQETDKKQDSNDELYTEVVYLEDIEKEKKDDTKKEVLKRKRRREIVEKRKRKSSSSSEDYFIKRKAPNKEGELENFGKYVTSLLKTVPRDVCTKLQVEIINIIMKARLNSQINETQNLKEPVLSNKVVLDGVPVTIQTVGTVPTGDIMLAVPTNNIGDSKTQSIVTSLAINAKNRIISVSGQANVSNEEITVPNVTVVTPSNRENGTVPSPSEYTEHGYSYTIAPLNSEKSDIIKTPE